ncbi:helix-turn-helix domain-containing protein [Slackia sp. CM382]|uniref:helix-turn-helix domain-containing protein n=1 Tax=Slackia sp. CM382 TaxID=1111137 RepID=UPI000587F7DD|nr:helix-turn-helix domain-containing protein [Slackia sp. CM382]
MARKYDIQAVFGSDFEFELTPDVLAYELSMDFSNQIIEQCAKVDMSLSELASLMEIRVSTLSEKLNGQNLTLRSIASMAIALGCDVKAPELIAEPEAACIPRSMPLEIANTGSLSIADKTWPSLKSTHKTKTTVDSNKRASSNYLLSEKLGKVA